MPSATVRWAAGAAIGTSHIMSGATMQDAHWIGRVDDFVMAIVSDGAGSAEYGGAGARLVCRHLSVRLREHIHASHALPDVETIEDWIDGLRDRLAKAAEARTSTRRQFAATVTGVVTDGRTGIVFQVGDSALAVRHEGGWSVPIWPQNGEYASSTYFVTEDPTPNLEVVGLEGFIQGLALFTDGVGELALSHADKAPFEGFLEPMLNPIRSAEGSGRLDRLSDQLTAYLHSEGVCEKTDDDKTLVLVVLDPVA